jgi:WD40 repeat protein
VCGSDGQLRSFDVQNPHNKPASVPLLPNPSCISMSTDGATVALGTRDGLCALYDSGSLVQRLFFRHTHKVTAVSAVSDERMLISSKTGTHLITDKETSIHVSQERMSLMRLYSSDIVILANVGVHALSLSQNKIVSSVRGHANMIRFLDFAEVDGHRRILSAAENERAVNIFNLDTSSLSLQLVSSFTVQSVPRFISCKVRLCSSYPVTS